MKISKKEKKEVSEGFGLRFRLLMGYHDLTLKDIATATQNAISTVSTWRNGRIPASSQAIERLAQQFHVSPSFLIFGRHDNDLCPFQHNLEEVSALMQTKRIKTGEPSSSSSTILADKILNYLQDYIRQASAAPYLLEHMWIQIQKEFVLEDIPPVPDNVINS
jgi:transcriptional regulator with XRE-family HTH domain